MRARILTLTSLCFLAHACGGDDGSGDTTGTGTVTATAGTTDTTTDTTTGATSGATSDGGTASGGTTTGSGGSTSGGSTTGALPPPEPGPDTVVTAFDGEHIYFLGEDNRREVDVQVTFPEGGLAYESVELALDLRCPNGLCDWWDRKGWIGIVNNPGTEDETLTEVARFMTPYRVEAYLRYDVTDLRPLLAGDVTLRVFIDTWVGPGHANGDGWLVDAAFDMKGGLPDELPIAAIPVWDLTRYEVGDPAKPYADQVVDRDIEVPAEASVFRVRSIITGHGQGNLDNCAEFCQKTHGYMVGDAPIQRVVWRDDCGDTPAQPQNGTWTLSRAGWCPGAEVLPWIEDVSSAVEPGGTVHLSYAMSDYENSCRPDSPSCMGCALGTGCDYDGGSHTPPEYYMSALLIAYREL